MNAPRMLQETQRIQQEQFARVFGSFARARVVALPFFLGLVLLVGFLEPSGWRTPLLLALSLVGALFMTREFLRYRQHGLVGGALFKNFFAAMAGISVVAFTTGGLSSPAIYALIPVNLLAFVVLPSGRAARVAIVPIAAVWVFAYLGHFGPIGDFNPSLFGGGRRHVGPPVYLYVHASALTLVLTLTIKVGGIVRKTLEEIKTRILMAQQASLDAHKERVQELTALSGEIAHELKNPLASVKGLAGLLAQSLTDGKPAERLRVLRHEVDRMQSVLDEFLNFSRPLVPLAIVATDVVEVCEAVAALHEGIADERCVRIEVAPGTALVHCDPRKLKQILINLVQNALEASRPGGTIEMHAVADDEKKTVQVQVVDDGPGLARGLGDVFQPGVTSKTGGTGIGLTIARALARQHGGDLTLRSRDEAAEPGRITGTVAELTLPFVARPNAGQTEAS